MARFAYRAGPSAAALLALLALSCGRSREDRVTGGSDARSPLISDQVHNGVPGFFWLPPMAPATTYGEFKPGLSPTVTVERLPLDPRRAPVAQFSGAAVKTDGESHYLAVWDTKASNLDPSAMYRIRVALGWFELGFADVDVVSSGSELRNVRTAEFIPLLDGRTLPIKFRIDLAAMKCPERREGPCQAKDQCHDAGECDPLTGECSDPPKPNGASCDDGSLCTKTDSCQGGTCVGTDLVLCTAADQCHLAGECDPATGTCSDPAKGDGTACDDQDRCTRSDTCQGGVCTGADPVVCDTPDQCHDLGVCDPLIGTCSNPEKAKGSPCDDRNACTQTDTCQAGACVGASPVICLASDQCHDAGTCDTATGACSNPAKADGSSCNDGDACTRSDTCQGGSCFGTDHVVCTAADQCHDAGACDPATGLCSSPAKPDGTTCDDGNPCTAAGPCIGGHFCTPADLCGEGRPECPNEAACVIRPGERVGVCAGCCTAADRCVLGTCAGIALNAVTCDDGDACTQNGCDPEASTSFGLTGCVYVPDLTPAACQTPPPEVVVKIVDLAPPGFGFFANDRLNFQVTLDATGVTTTYVLEFLMHPVITDPNNQTEYQGFSIGNWQVPKVEQGRNTYSIDFAIPRALVEGSWEVSVHEYPTGEFFPPDVQDDGRCGLVGADRKCPVVLAVAAAAPELPVLDITTTAVAQAALLVDPASLVTDSAIYHDTPFAADLELVAYDQSISGVPVTARVEWQDPGSLEPISVPLRIWDPSVVASPQTGRWVETLVVNGLEQDAPRGLYLELAVAEADAGPILASLATLPPGAAADAAIVIAVNGGDIAANGTRPVEEGTCVPVADPNAPASCRHTATLQAMLYAPPPAPMKAAFRMMALAAPAATDPVAVTTARYEKSWSKRIGNDWARTGIGFSGYAQLAGVGYDAQVQGNVPVELLRILKFDFLDAKAWASAHRGNDLSCAGQKSNTCVGYDWAVLGLYKDSKSFLTAYDLDFYWEESKEQKKTVMLGPVPVEFTLGASAKLGVKGSIGATFASGTSDVASITLSGGPYANADAYGEGGVGAPFLSAGARVTLTLVDANLTATATGRFTLAKRTDNGRPLEIGGSLTERLGYETSFLNGRVGLVVTYPTLRWCKVWRIRFPCGFRLASQEAVLASWPGFGYSGELLNESQELFSVDVCTRTSCSGRCGWIDDGCGTVDFNVDPVGVGTRFEDCGTCPNGQACNADGTCVCVPATCNGRCGTIDDGCGGSVQCGGCADGQVCQASACVPSGDFAFPGLYDAQLRWGGCSGTWMDETMDSRALDVTVHADGRAFRGGVPILDSTVSATNVSWSVPNGSNGNITFRPRSDNACIWGPSIREGPLFEGLGGPALQGIQFPGEGWLDFRGARTCVPTTTCAGVCGAMFDGCSQVVCPMVLYSDATERYMDANCFDYLLPRTMSVKGATATTMAVTQDGSWAWVYFYSAWPHEPPSPVGYIETTPANYGRVRVTKEFNPPIQVNSVRICSWWQDARLLGLELLGDQAACTR